MAISKLIRKATKMSDKAQTKACQVADTTRHIMTEG